MEVHEMFKGKSAMGRTKTFEWLFSNSSMGKRLLKTLSIQIIPPQVGQMKTSESLQDHKGWPIKYQFGDCWQMEHANEF
jgi:hypothetical protein